MAKSSNTLWIIQDAQGLKGPFETKIILQMISDGKVSGDELIALYPGGEWRQVSKTTEFYDYLLETLEGVSKKDEQKKQKNISEETLFMPPPPSSQESILHKKEGEFVVPAPAQTAPVAHAVFEMPKPKAKEEKIWSQLGAREKTIAIAIIILALSLYIFFSPQTESVDLKIRLLSVGKNSQQLADAEAKKIFANALSHMTRTTFEDDLQAQNKIVRLIEGQAATLEARSLLCLAYRNLWPFAYQDSIDQKTISQFTQATRVLDVTSPYGSLCDILRMMSFGKLQEAKGAMDSLLENIGSQPFSMLSVAYAIKAELLEIDRNYKLAIEYYEKASQQWPDWLLPKLRIGFAQIKEKNYPLALEWFKTANKAHNNHKAILIGRALVEFQGFRQTENAKTLLAQALALPRRLNAEFESQAWTLYSEVHLELGDKKAALKSAQKAYEIYPSNTYARDLIQRLGGQIQNKNDKNQNSELLFVGDQYAKQGDCLSAQAEYKAAFEIDKKNATAAMKAAKCLWQLNQSFEAIEWLNRAIKADPKMITPYVLQADYLSQRFDFNTAAQVLNSASRMSPNNHEVLRGMALLEFRKNNMAAAINFAQRSMKAYDADIETYTLLSKANLRLALSIQSNLKQENEKKENAFKDAVRYATKAVEYDSTNVEAQVAYAKMLAATNGTESAIDYIKELIIKYSHSAEYRIALADIYKEVERWSDARIIYEIVVDSDPRNKKAWIGLGEALRATGYNEKALKSFLNAAVIDPTDAEALFQAGRVYFEGSRFEESLQQFIRVKNLNPYFPRASYYAGRAAFALKNFDDAIRFADDEKRINPNLADSYILTAEVHAAQEAYSKCASEYAQAIKLRPGGAEIYVKAAQCYRQAGSLEIATTMLTLATERESGYPDIYKETGALFEKKNDAQEAVRAYYKYLELAPNAPDRRDIEARVRRMGGQI